MELSPSAYAAAVAAARHQMVSSTLPVSLDQKGNVSTIFAQSVQRAPGGKLDLSAFVGVIAFDCDAGTVTVGGKTPFKALTEYTLPQGWAPKVVPELDTITVGGALSGVGIESSSFRYGFVHNTVESFELLLGDGRVLKCSRTENEDLFRGMAHSYGTLGYALSVTLNLLRTKCQVLVEVRRLPLEGTVAALDEAMRARTVDYLEGLALSADEGIAITASFSGDVDDDTELLMLPGAGCFKDLVVSRCDGRFRLSTYDYLWRWDADMFWGTEQFPGGFPLRFPLLRRLLGRTVLRASVLWRIGSRLRHVEVWVRNLAAWLGLPVARIEMVIQDMGVPMAAAATFVRQLAKGGHACPPYWLCPATFGDGLALARDAALWPAPRGSADGRIMDVAAFGSVPRHPKHPNKRYFHNRAIDAIIAEHGGSKTFYSDVLYSREFVHEHFNGAEYDRLKAKYDPKGRFPLLYDKVINKDCGEE